MSETHIPTYSVKIISDSLPGIAYLAEADESDIAEVSILPGFQCDWETLWKNTDFNCEALVKLTYQGKIQGLVKFGLFPPHTAPDEMPQFMEILNIESIARKDKIISPAGLWLIWYVVEMCLKVGCSGDSQGSILVLVSLESAISYYRDKVKMEGLQWVTISPYEEGYAFRFSKDQAIEFLYGTQAEYGEATEVKR
jgi:hypothetical protein